MCNQTRSSSRLSACLMARIFPMRRKWKRRPLAEKSWTGQVKSRTPSRVPRIILSASSELLLRAGLSYLSPDERHSKSKLDLRKQIWFAWCDSRDSGLGLEHETHAGTRFNLLVKAETPPLLFRKSELRNLHGLHALRCYFTTRRDERIFFFSEFANDESFSPSSRFDDRFQAVERRYFSR